MHHRWTLCFESACKSKNYMGLCIYHASHCALGFCFIRPYKQGEKMIFFKVISVEKVTKKECEVTLFSEKPVVKAAYFTSLKKGEQIKGSEIGIKADLTEESIQASLKKYLGVDANVYKVEEPKCLS